MLGIKMISSFWRGLALVVVWIVCAFIYQSLFHTYNYQKSVASTIETAPMKSAKRVVRRKRKMKRKRKRKKPYLLEVRVRDSDMGVDIHQIEKEFNQMSVELIELKISQGIPNGNK